MKRIGLLLLLLGFAACTTRLTDYTILNTKNFTLPKNVKLGKRATGEDCKLVILFWPLGTPSLKEAVDKALEKGNGDILVDAVVYSETRSYLVVSQLCWVVTGTVGKTW